MYWSLSYHPVCDFLQRAGIAPPALAQCARHCRSLLAALMLLSGLWLTLPAHAYTVDMRGAEQFSSLLEEYLDIYRHRNDPDISADELQRLAGITPRQIRELLATQGYFSPAITQELIQDQSRQLARFIVDPGLPTTIAAVNIRFHGAIASGPAARLQRMQRLQRQWPLQPGDVFVQSEWTQAKNGLLKGLLIRDFPAAAITRSEALIDPVQHRATLNIDIDSGPAFTFGELQIEGLERYPRKIVDAANPIMPGERYSQEKLNELQSRLADTGYFRSVFPNVEINPAQPLNVPIKLSLTENPRKHLALGLGFSTDTGAGIQLKWLDRNFLERNWRLQSEIEFNRETNLLGAELFLPARRNGWTPSVNANYERTMTAGEVNDKIRTGGRFTSPSRTDERSAGIAFLADRQQLPGNVINNRQALIASYSYTRRRVNSLIAPRRGYVAAVELGAGPRGLVNEGNIVRATARITWLQPIQQRWQSTLRGQVGQVFIAERTAVPADLLFRTGGSQSVRGYGYNSLGVTENSAVVGGRVLAIFSAEMVYRITPEWGAAAFHDLGNASDRWSDFRFSHGSGIGARWRSPIGPINFDLAYGHQTGKPQLHFSVGYVF